MMAISAELTRRYDALALAEVPEPDDEAGVEEAAEDDESDDEVEELGLEVSDDEDFVELPAPALEVDRLSVL